jgi:hypothetical protein
VETLVQVILHFLYWTETPLFTILFLNLKVFRNSAREFKLLFITYAYSGILILAETFNLVVANGADLKFAGRAKLDDTWFI